MLHGHKSIVLIVCKYIMLRKCKCFVLHRYKFIVL